MCVCVCVCLCVCVCACVYLCVYTPLTTRPYYNICGWSNRITIRCNPTWSCPRVSIFNPICNQIYYMLNCLWQSSFGNITNALIGFFLIHIFVCDYFDISHTFSHQLGQCQQQLCYQEYIKRAWRFMAWPVKSMFLSTQYWNCVSFIQTEV